MTTLCGANHASIRRRARSSLLVKICLAPRERRWHSRWNTHLIKGDRMQESASAARACCRKSGNTTRICRLKPLLADVRRGGAILAFFGEYRVVSISQPRGVRSPRRCRRGGQFDSDRPGRPVRSVRHDTARLCRHREGRGLLLSRRRCITARRADRIPCSTHGDPRASSGRVGGWRARRYRCRAPSHPYIARINFPSRPRNAFRPPSRLATGLVDLPLTFS